MVHDDVGRSMTPAPELVEIPQCMGQMHTSAREHEVLKKVEASSAEHRAAASASLRDGSWQQQAHLLITRRTARVRSGYLAGWRHASSSDGAGYEVRVFTRAQPEGVFVRVCDDLGLPAPHSAPRRVADRI